MIASLGINNKISTINIDNAYNMVNAFSLPEFDTLIDYCNKGLWAASSGLGTWVHCYLQNCQV